MKCNLKVYHNNNCVQTVNFSTEIVLGFSLKHDAAAYEGS